MSKQKTHRPFSGWVMGNWLFTLKRFRSPTAGNAPIRGHSPRDHAVRHAAQVQRLGLRLNCHYVAVIYAVAVMCQMKEVVAVGVSPAVELGILDWRFGNVVVLAT